MIKINLALKKQSVGSSGKPTAAGGMEDFTKAITRLDMARASESPIFKLILCLVVAGVGFMLKENFQDEELAKIDARIAKVNSQIAAQKNELGKFASDSKQYDAIEKERLELQAKLELIQKLISDRDSSSRLLLALANQIPSTLWLKDLKIGSAEFSLSGSALVGEGTGLDQVSDFVASLNENPLLTDVKLAKTSKEKDEKGVDVTAFDVTSKRR